MKIAIFADNFYPELSGISDSIITLTQELVKLGHKIQIHAPFYSEKEYKIANINFSELFLGENVSIIRLSSISYKKSPTRQSRIAFLSIKSILAVRKFKPDIIHVHSPFGTGLSGVLVAKIFKIPLVGTNHTIIAEFAYFAPFCQLLVAKITSHYDAWFYNQCSFVSAPSQIVFTEMKKYGFKKEHKVISNPISNIFFLAPILEIKKQQLKQKLAFSPSTIVFAGALAVHKKIDILFHALALSLKTIPDIKLVLAGDGADLVKLQKLAYSLELENNVIFLGKISSFQLAEVFLAAEIFALASTAETQNMALLQAQAVYLPAICVNARALPEYIFDNDNGLLVEIDNPEDFAKKIIFLLQNSKLQRQMGHNANKYAQQFSANKIAVTWEKTYQKLT